MNANNFTPYAITVGMVIGRSRRYGRRNINERTIYEETRAANFIYGI